MSTFSLEPGAGHGSAASEVSHSFFSKLSHVADELLFRVRHGGLLGVWRWLRDRLEDRASDERFGIVSWERREAQRLGLNSSEFVPYQAFSYRDLYEILDLLPITSSDALLDLGSGMGRVLCVGATYPFQSVVGVEISAELCALARENVDRVRSKLLCPEVQVIHSDARDYRIPADVTVILLFNPFNGSVLRRVLENIRESVRASPRPMRLLFYGTVATRAFKECAREHAWLSLREERTLATGAVVLTYVERERVREGQSPPTTSS